MRIFYYFYYKFFVAFSTCLLTCSIIFYIFSLLGNLGESLSFASILYLSLINTLQILSNIPSMVVLLSIILFVIFLRSNNELMIFKEYVSVNKLLLFFMPFVLIFTVIDINKKYVSSYLEDIKTNFVNSNNNSNNKVIIKKDKYFKTYIILKNLDVSKKIINEFQKYIINEDSIIAGEYSNNIVFENNNIIANNYVQFKDNKIIEIDKKNIVYNKIYNLMKSNFIVNEIKNNRTIKFDSENIYKFTFYFFFYNSIFLILFSKIIVDRKKNFYFPMLISALLFLYSFIITNLELMSYNKELQILALILILITFIKYYKYE